MTQVELGEYFDDARLVATQLYNYIDMGDLENPFKSEMRPIKSWGLSAIAGVSIRDVVSFKRHQFSDNTSRL